MKLVILMNINIYTNICFFWAGGGGTNKKSRLGHSKGLQWTKLTPYQKTNNNHGNKIAENFFDVSSLLHHLATKLHRDLKAEASRREGDHLPFHHRANVANLCRGGKRFLRSQIKHCWSGKINTMNRSAERGW